MKNMKTIDIRNMDTEQKELWNEVLNTCQEHIINDVRLLEMLARKYTLKRIEHKPETDIMVNSNT